MSHRSVPSPDSSRTPSGTAANAAEHLDLRGLKCPLPALRTRRALARLPAGAVLVVLCSDPLATLDIPHLVRSTGDDLVANQQAGTETRFLIRKR